MNKKSKRLHFDSSQIFQIKFALVSTFAHFLFKCNAAAKGKKRKNEPIVQVVSGFKFYANHLLGTQAFFKCL